MTVLVMGSEAGNSSSLPLPWSWEQEKAFENALATHPELEDSNLDWWNKIAANVPGKTLEQIKHHYSLLLDDVSSIDSGLVPLPSYTNRPRDGHLLGPPAPAAGKNKGGGTATADSTPPPAGGNNGAAGKPSRAEQERRKGIAWTEEEHRLFLLGLDKYGKGDWRSISRNFVVTRTPTQVASHAQKYFIRLNSINKDRRRSSIHDITSVDTGDLSVSQGPITGQGNTGSAAPVIASSAGGISTKQPPQSRPAASGLGSYGASGIGQSIAVGTPVNLPAPMGYNGSPIPMNIGSMGFPVPPTFSS